MAEDVETKLSAARTRLILDKPFLGALVLRLPMVAGDPKWCRTTATDARKFYYNADYIDALSVEQTQFVLAHEALHCALSHFTRRQHRSRRRWDIACDLAVNPLLLRDGLKPPPGALVMEQYEGMSAEEIYPNVQEDTDQETLDEHLYDPDEGTEGSQQGGQGMHESDFQGGEGGEQSRDEGGAGGGARQQEDPQAEGGEREQESTPRAGAPRPKPLSAREREQLSVQWQQRLAGAAQQAMAAGKLGGGMARLVDHLLAPQLPWRMLLAKYMTALARDDYNYVRPSRREGAAILPSLRSNQVDVVVALDISGSIDEREIAEFLSEVDAIKGQVSARITLHTCDAELAADGPWVYEPWEEFRLPRAFKGGGGTRFTPVFEWIEREQRRPDLLIYFTDAQGEFPAEEPPYPVVWLVKGKGEVPWGERIQLN